MNFRLKPLVQSLDIVLIMDLFPLEKYFDRFIQCLSRNATQVTLINSDNFSNRDGNMLLFQGAAIIGKTCPNLIELDLSGTGVTDKGLVQLCHSDENIPRCQKLTRLAVTEGYCTHKGVTHVVMWLPQIRDIEFPAMFKVNSYNLHNRHCK